MVSTRRLSGIPVEDLAEGQKLVSVRHATFSYDVIDGLWKIMRLAKTRAVIALVNQVEGADVVTSVTRRLIVRDDELTAREEGRPESSRYVSYYTADDPDLVKIAERAKVESAKIVAHGHADAFRRQRDVATAKQAIEALQTYVALAEALEESD